MRRAAAQAARLGLGLTADVEDRLPEGWHAEAFESFQQLEIYASPNVTVAAQHAYETVLKWGDATRRGEDDEAFYDGDARTDVAIRDMVESIRSDLRVPNDDGH